MAGRGAELNRLLELLSDTVQGRGSIVFIEGDGGLGVSARFLENRPIGDEGAGPGLVLEIARHPASGGQELAAARDLYLAARSSFREGALVEAGRLCRQVFLELKMVPPGAEGRDQLLAASVLLLLTCLVDVESGRTNQKKLLALALLGEEAATAAGDATLLVQMKSVKGYILEHLGDGRQALAAMQEALDQAGTLDDPLAEAAALVNLKSRLAGEDLESGIGLRYEAADAYETRLKADHDRVALRRASCTVMASLSIHEFDKGDFDTAAGLATEAYNGLTDVEMNEDLHWVSNYLGQIHTATGRFEEAEQILTEAIALRKDASGTRAWHGYNLALLGKLYLEWGRVADAVEPILQGWRESEETRQADLLALVRNYHAQLLMYPGYADRDLYLAEEQLTQSIRETRPAGLIRSTVTALSLRGQLALMQGRIDEALRDSGQAMSYIRDRGALPAVRLEELLFYHYRVLAAAGLQKGAGRFLAAAAGILHRKASTLRNPDDRRRFLERIPISRAIRHTLSRSAHLEQ
jgi:tetratricopeptide (TPR) repeat protein